MTTHHFLTSGEVGHCEATIGYDLTSSVPKATPCGRTNGTWRNASVRPFGVILCDEHWDAYENRVKGLRKIN